MLAAEPLYEGIDLFDIDITDETIEDSGEILHLGKITLGGITEGFAASTSYWSRGSYRDHWLAAARRLLKSGSTSAFVTSLYDPASANFIFWWPAWRTNGLVIFQQQLLFLTDPGLGTPTPSSAKFTPESPYLAVPNWDSTHCEDCRNTGVCRRPRLGKKLPDTGADYCPSEWCIQVADIEDFLFRRADGWAR